MNNMSEKSKRYCVTSGRPSLVVPGDHLNYCDENKQPLIIVWARIKKADVTWLNEPYQRSHQWLFACEDFRQDIEVRAERIYLQYATKSTARAITHSFMTFYDFSIEDAKRAADDLYDMTVAIIKEYQSRKALITGEADK